MAVFGGSNEERGRSFGMKRLVKDNYVMWQFNIQTLLEEEDLWGFVDGTEIKPATDADGLLTKYLKRNKRCRKLLIFSMEEESQKLIMRLEDPKAIWDKRRRLIVREHVSGKYKPRGNSH